MAAQKARAKKTARKKVTAKKSAVGKKAKKAQTKKRVAKKKAAAKKKASAGKSVTKKAALKKKASTGKSVTKKAAGKKIVGKKKVTRRGAILAKSPAQKNVRKQAGKPAPAVDGLGERVPVFGLLDQDGNEVSSASLSGKRYVLYFYPKDDTPGCTTEACGFRDALPQFTSSGIEIIGVSPDKPGAHQRFRAKYSLPFTLLCDPEHVLSSALGVWALKKNYGREYMGIVRSTFLVDEQGIIRNAWRNVRVAGHVPAVLDAAVEL